MKKTRLWLLSLMVIVPASSLGACGRAHLSSQYGQAYTAWFVAQHARTKTPPEDSRRIIESLDAGEAGAVSRNYRKARGVDEQAGRMLTIGTKAGGADSYMPPASSGP